MESERITIGERGYVAVISYFKNRLMLHVRKYYEDKPTRYGMALTPKEWWVLLGKVDKIDDLLQQMQEEIDQRQDQEESEQSQDIESEKLPIGFRGYHAQVSEYKNNLNIHVRIYENEKPTKYGMSLNQIEWKILLSEVPAINNILKEMQK